MNSTLAQSFIEEIQAWLDSRRGLSLPRSLWFECPELKAYLRFIPHTMLSNGRIVLSNIEVFVKRRGKCSALLDFLEAYAELHGLQPVYVESVVSPDMRTLLETRGYKPINDALGSDWADAR